MNVFAMLGSGLAGYVGASLAVILFATASDLTVAWGRIATAALILILWRRPWDYPDKMQAALFGIALGGMNILFYLAIDRIALGTAVSLEFLGPVALAASARTRRSLVAVLFALAGVLLISWVGLDLSEPGVLAGVAYALAAGATWAVYMVMAKRNSSRGRAIDGLAIAMASAALVYSPLGLLHGAPMDGTFWLTMAGVGLLSSVIPYGIDQYVLTDMPATTFAILNAILPAMSLAVGLVMLSQWPTGGEVAGLVLISLAILIATYSRVTPRRGAKRRA